MEFLIEYGLFFAKVLTVAVAIVFVIGSAVSFGSKGKPQSKGDIHVKNINDSLKSVSDSLRCAVLSPEAAKVEVKKDKKAKKLEQKQLKKSLKLSAKASARSKRVFVLNFDGDIKASAVENLRREISAVVGIADSQDEVLVCLESGGGLVHSYGLAASQLARLKSRNIPLTVCVDKVAASGGYMMACIADKIIAAPFAMIGSIGVVAQIPNFHRVLKKNDIDVEILTAGEYKRTLTLFGENTEKGREKFVEDLELTHDLFKNFVAENRPKLDIDAISTGEVWYGTQAIENKLVDELGTSDDYLLSVASESDVFAVSYEEKKSLSQRLGMDVASVADHVALTWWERINRRWL